MKPDDLIGRLRDQPTAIDNLIQARIVLALEAISDRVQDATGVRP